MFFEKALSPIATTLRPPICEGTSTDESGPSYPVIVMLPPLFLLYLKSSYTISVAVSAMEPSTIEGRTTAAAIMAAIANVRATNTIPFFPLRARGDLSPLLVSRRDLLFSLLCLRSRARSARRDDLPSSRDSACSGARDSSTGSGS